MPEFGPELRDLIEHALAPLDVDAVVSNRRRQRRRRRIGSAVAVFAAIAIGGASAWTLSNNSHKPAVAVRVAPTTSTNPSTFPGTRSGAPRYRVDATVEQDAKHPATLCVLPTADIARRDPFDCGGPRITNWDWNLAPNAKHVGDFYSGRYRVVGTYDGKVLTLTEPPVAAATPRPLDHPTAPAPSTPCPTPPGGWTTTNPSRISFADYQAVTNAAQGAPDYAGMWLDPTTEPPGSPVNDFTKSEVIDFAFTGNLAEHQAQLAAIWGGPICIVQHQHSYAEL